MPTSFLPPRRTAPIVSDVVRLVEATRCLCQMLTVDANFAGKISLKLVLVETTRIHFAKANLDLLDTGPSGRGRGGRV